MHEIRALIKGKVIFHIEKSDIYYILCQFAAAFLFSLGTNSKGLSPFGIGVTAGIWLYGDAPFVSLAGVVIGSLLCGDYACACSSLLFVISVLTFSLMGKTPSKQYKLMALLLSQLAVLPIFHNTEPLMFLYCFASMSLSFFFAIITDKSLCIIKELRIGKIPNSSRLMPLMFLFAATVFCLGRFNLAEFSFSAVAAVFFTLLCIKLGGVPGAASSIVFGAAYMLGTSADILFIGMLCICATLSALSAQYGRWCIPTVFSSCACIAVFLSAHSNVFILESVIASSAYIMLPRSFLHKLELCSENKSPALIEASLYSLQFKLREASQVICTVAKMFAPSGDERVKLANRQLLATGQLMVKLADGCMAEPIQRNYRVAVGAAACPKAGNEETGDSIAVREYDTNILLALSDGMGSGKKAHKESAAAVTLLSDLLSIGFDLKNALECVNMLMLQRSENDMYTTVDAVCINLSNLNTSFVKQGAPDSYIVRGQKVFTLCSQALPIGILAQARASLHETKLRSGDFVFMMTDGMSESLCDLLPDILLDLPSQFEDLNAMADYLLCMARRLSDRDDMTIIIANIENMRKNS